ncbi:hypothetical protein ILUMI_17549 [Ignelater luminosus]|uniref:Uncharacterized protein n=1 Tax=Ignelater luminosus TaxID=2038154 RepID=A0A8K0CJN9_IGNLU|nr:hypothetical protein ILUMI_17549 [Ignelater luminosus]
MFGTKLKIGLKIFLPHEVLADVNSEDLEVPFKNQEAEQSTEPIIIQNNNINVDCSIVSPESSREPSHALPLHNREVQKYATATCATKVGDTVRVREPDVDRVGSDQRNLLATVTEITENNLYKLGTKYCILN